jgi:hypothetical protein
MIALERYTIAVSLLKGVVVHVFDIQVTMPQVTILAMNCINPDF